MTEDPDVISRDSCQRIMDEEGLPLIGASDDLMRCVKLRVDSFQAVVVALQLVAQRVPVALLLPEQFAVGRRDNNLPPREVAADAPARASALLECEAHFTICKFLDAAASIFGVAQWPADLTSLPLQ